MSDTNHKDLTFSEKIRLCNDLLSFFESSDVKKNGNENSQSEIKDLHLRLQKWHKELRVRQLYYDT